ncbi:type 1 glutamine amidotransferase [Halodesulfurarchaeum formicicum]|uniref:type 1 glutamine amidotransferase n=1 Tax=Halodesulfurarchaeum formicicum TaxID=1873524 RepID=UPI000BA9EF6D|nr:type 1 glutamine amidotransferase [Halodesulfurarchaeum formicicum]
MPVLDIALIDASIGETPAQRNFERVTEAALTGFKVSEGAEPPTVTGPEAAFDAVIVTGSQCSVYEDRPWIHRLTEWAREAHAAGVPLFGICWGHQFLAQALGGRIVAMDDYELGYRAITRTTESRLLDGIPETFVAFETHSDRVYELPEGATRLAENDVGIQAYRLGRTYGVQFHPEYDMETARKVTRGKDLPAERIESVLAEITPETFEKARPAARVFENFEAIVTDAA